MHKNYITLLGATLLTFTLTSCYMPPGGYPPGTGITPVPIPVPIPKPTKLELDSYRVQSITVYRVPSKKHNGLTWDAPNPFKPLLLNPDLYAECRVGSNLIGRSATRNNHNPFSSTSLSINSSSRKYIGTPYVNVKFFDRDKSNNDYMGYINVKVPKPSKGTKTYSQTVNTGSFRVKVNYQYNWVRR